MGCTNPLQGFFSGVNGQFIPSREAYQAFRSGDLLDGQVAVPCGTCLSCSLKRTTDWAVRCTHEASFYEQNCFVTLTFSNKYLQEMCPKVVWKDPWSYFSSEGEVLHESYSLKKSHMQNFMKDLRREFSGQFVRSLYCGEYGTRYQRPHYHVILFNCSFSDLELYKVKGDYSYYNSKVLSSLWPYGHAIVANFSYDTAAYVARYCVDLVRGKNKDMHYKGRLSEFSQASLKPGIGHNWIEKYFSDVYPSDQLVVDVGGDIVKLRPPRFYDKYLKKVNPFMYEHVVSRRKEFVQSSSSDNTYDRLLAKHKNVVARYSKLTRSLYQEESA